MRATFPHINMIQVLEHNYGKGRFTRRQIRAAIKAVRADKAAAEAVVQKAAGKASAAIGKKAK